MSQCVRRYTSGASVTHVRHFQARKYQRIHASVKVEEELLPFYTPRLFYPVRLGQILNFRYQVISKLGYGTTSTNWLCRDLLDMEQRFVTLKIHINTLHHNQEFQIYQHLRSVADSGHIGLKSIRMMGEFFQLQGPHGIHDVFVLPPLGCNLQILQEKMADKVFDVDFVRAALQRVLPALDFLHNEARVTHTDFHSGNLLCGLNDRSALEEYEKAESTKPAARKETSDAIIYVSRTLVSGIAPIFLCDFGEARIGSEFQGLAQPCVYRAPEVILDMRWGAPVDMWSVGLALWDLMEPQSLFHIYDRQNPEMNEAEHLATMVAVMGPPPQEFLARSAKARKYWDLDGNWTGRAPIPHQWALENLESSLVGTERAKFLEYIRGFLRWIPEDRMTAAEAYMHPWLRDYGGIESEIEPVIVT